MQSTNLKNQSPTLYYFESQKALADFETQPLLSRIKHPTINTGDISVHLIYCVAVTSPIENESYCLDQLLTLLPNVQQIACPKKEDSTIYVFPRLSILSPWSSKATEVAKICGLSGLQRIDQGRRYRIKNLNKAMTEHLYDPLTESLITDPGVLKHCFTVKPSPPVKMIDLLKRGQDALIESHHKLGLGLSKIEIDYLLSIYQKLKRNPTDAELMMFAQVNSEHCRHKIFKAAWNIDGVSQKASLFDMIHSTYQAHPNEVLIAYHDNASVLKGSLGHAFLIDPETHQYRYYKEPLHIVFKVETHNHPTAISPFPGAATGSGGEIRDESATGRGACPKMGLSGFSVSHLHIPDFPQPWEIEIGHPKHMASALEIMLAAPIGNASFNNEFGRPSLVGYFRTFAMTLSTDYGNITRAYHKPIMIAGGIGYLRETAINKQTLPVGAKLIVLGGPAMPIGLGGGSASSSSTNDKRSALDFASVQRANPEMQRRCQEVINACWTLGEDNPILSIHDVGAGGLSNALPELVMMSNRGAHLQLRDIPNAAPEMTPMEIWCNEAQERFVLAVLTDNLNRFIKIAKRERCPYAVLGETTASTDFQVHDADFKNCPVNVSLPMLFKQLPRLQCQVERVTELHQPFKTDSLNWRSAIKNVLQFPCVSSKHFLISIADRTVTGLAVRDPMVGPWQVPVSDVGVTASDYVHYTGEALAMGERAPIALLHPAASARMAIGEVITNIAAALIKDMSHVTLSANWMAAPSVMGDAAALYDAVQAVTQEICPALEINIPVGKDSLSMHTEWQEQGEPRAATAPLSLIISAAAKVVDTRHTLTPQLQTDQGQTILLLIDLGRGACSIGASVLAQTQGVLGQRPPDLDNPKALKSFFNFIQSLNQSQLILAYHDRSDGGLLATITEMMFAAHVGVDLSLNHLHQDDPMAALFNEELGAVIQIRSTDLNTVQSIASQYELTAMTHCIGTINTQDILRITFQHACLFSESRTTLQQWWSETSYRMQALRDCSECAEEEYKKITDSDDPGLNVYLTFDIDQNIATPYLSLGAKPKVAILRDQGTNGQSEMAAAFQRVGFDTFDVPMSALLSNEQHLKDFIGLAACGGFSYGDVLGAGRAWAKSILMHSRLKASFSDFFNRPNTFALGVCNGCQMFSYIKTMIPGAMHWPSFKRNRSKQFEGRLSLLKVEKSPSIFLTGMEGSILPIPTAHGEGRAVFDTEKTKISAALHYVDHHHYHTEHYPENPNGSPGGAAGFSTKDGRVTILMPHPERAFRTIQLSWHPKHWKENGPWLRFFENARKFVN